MCSLSMGYPRGTHSSHMIGCYLISLGSVQHGSRSKNNLRHYLWKRVCMGVVLSSPFIFSCQWIALSTLWTTGASPMCLTKEAVGKTTFAVLTLTAQLRRVNCEVAQYALTNVLQADQTLNNNILLQNIQLRVTCYCNKYVDPRHRISQKLKHLLWWCAVNCVQSPLDDFTHSTLNFTIYSYQQDIFCSLLEERKIFSIRPMNEPENHQLSVELTCCPQSVKDLYYQNKRKIFLDEVMI